MAFWVNSRFVLLAVKIFRVGPPFANAKTNKDLGEKENHRCVYMCAPSPIHSTPDKFFFSKCDQRERRALNERISQ